MKNIKNNNVLGGDLEKCSNDPLKLYIEDGTNRKQKKIWNGIFWKRKKICLQRSLQSTTKPNKNIIYGWY